MKRDYFWIVLVCSNLAVVGVSRMLPEMTDVKVAGFAVGPQNAPVVQGEQPKPLTNEVKLEGQTLVQRIMIANLQATNADLQMRQAQRDLTEAREELLKFLQVHQAPGYDLDPQTWTYVKKSEPVKKE